MEPALIVIGSGLAGYTLVKEFRKYNKDRRIIMISQDDGREYSKPMLSTGFSKGKDAEALAMNSADAMARSLEIEIRTFQQVSAIDTKRRTVFVQEDEIEYSDLVLALGSEPIQLPIEGNEYLMHINDLMDYHEFHKSVQGTKNIVILGAGLVGCEYAHDLSLAGFNIALVAPEEQPLSRLVPKECGETLIPALKDLGVRMYMGRSAMKIAKVDDRFEVSLDDNTTISADVLLSAVGLRARTALAKAAGLNIGVAIEVDRGLKTSENNIYALGDCAEVSGLHLLYVQPLINCARSLAKTLVGQNNLIKYPVMPVVVKTPSMPVATCPPSDLSRGRWIIEGRSPHLQAVFRDSDDNLLGYALTGECVAEKRKLSQELLVEWF